VGSWEFICSAKTTVSHHPDVQQLIFFVRRASRGTLHRLLPPSGAVGSIQKMVPKLGTKFSRRRGGILGISSPSLCPTFLWLRFCWRALQSAALAMEYSSTSHSIRNFAPRRKQRSVWRKVALSLQLKFLRLFPASATVDLGWRFMRHNIGFAVY
jgi:hypothetical protein